MVLVSFIAVGITIAMIYPALILIEPQVDVYFGSQSAGLFEYFTQNGLLIFGGEFLALVIITFVSTGMAMKKYLKV